MQSYHRNDPQTSVEASERIEKSGRARSIREQCREYVGRFPGQTAGEIGDGTGLGHMSVERRLSDLKNDGVLIQGDARPWHGRRQVTWFLALPAKEVQSVMDMGVEEERSWVMRH